MKTFKTSPFIVSFFSALAITVSAQQTDLESVMFDIIGDDLQKRAEVVGYTLDSSSLRLSFPKTNLLIPINSIGSIVLTGTTSFGGGVVIGVTGMATTGFIGMFNTAIKSFSTMAVVFYTASVLDHMDKMNIKSIRFFDFMYYVHHFRSKMYYSVISKENGEIVKGSCLLFFYQSKEIHRVFYEVDECSDEHIFPQEEEGQLRVGQRVDFIEKYLSDQDEVVATGWFPFF